MISKERLEAIFEAQRRILIASIRAMATGHQKTSAENSDDAALRRESAFLHCSQ